MSRVAACLLLAFGLLAPRPAAAYSLRSALTKTCHEQISLRAFLIVTAPLDIDGRVPQPDSKTWRLLAERLAEGLPDTIDKDNPELQLLMLSMLVGVRAPDTEGHSVSDLNALRRIHADPSDVGQYAHALRGIGDDGPEGDAAAVEGTRQVILDLIRQARAYARRPPKEQLISATIALDFYGPVEVEVWAPAYYLARAAHALQDSFSHTIRSPDHRQIVSVLNYVEAVSGELDEARDGIAHSDSLDTCEEATAPLVAAAEQATVDLLSAAATSMGGDDDLDQTVAVLDAWVTYAGGCTLANGYCDSPWVEVAREDATGPYLGPLACRAQPGEDASWFGLALLGLLAGWRRRWAALALLLTPFDAAAQVNVQVESHVSLLSDAPGRSALASSYGFSTRAGWRFGWWGLVLHAERNYWVASEIEAGTHGGVFNLGLGGELLFADGRVRASYVLGASVLREATFLHDKGQIGVFSTLRPIGLRWETAPHVFLAFDPLLVAVVAPAVFEPRLFMLQYRSNIGVEYAF